MRGVFLLIFNIVDEIEDTQSYFKRLFKGKKKNITRDYEVINKIPFDIITLSYCDYDNDSIKYLLNINKGKVLESNDKKCSKKIEEYLFDKTPYIKKSLLSSVSRFIEKSGFMGSVLVIDNDFSDSTEFCELCKKSKALTIACDDFCDYDFISKIYYTYGLKVNVRKSVSVNQSDMIIDFSKICNNTQFYIDYLGDKIPVNPDNSYFEMNENVLKLIGWGVPIKCACAVLCSG